MLNEKGRHMKKGFLLSVAVATALLASPLAAQENAPQQQKPQQQTLSPADIATIQWMDYFYFHKDVSKVPDYLAFIDRTLPGNEAAVQPTVAFLSIVFAENKDKVEGWVKPLKLSPKAAEVVASALWVSGNSDKVTLITGTAPEWAAKKPPVLTEQEVKGPADLGVMWLAFAASGSEVYVKKVATVLNEDTKLLGNKESDQATRTAAENSLAANILTHELVNRAVNKEAKTAKGKYKAKLDKIIADTRAKITALPTKDGDFSAMLVVTSVEDAKAFDTPGSEAKTLNDKPSAKRGEQVALNTIFSGMALSDTLSADVTYDMQVLDPEGKVYDKFAEKNLDALKGRVPGRFRVFHGNLYPVLKFSPTDKLGKYTVKAEIRDNIGKKKVALTKTIELTE